MAIIVKTPQEITEFLEQPGIDFVNQNTKQSFKSNILIIGRNFVTAKIFNNKLLDFVKFLYQKIDTTFISNQVLRVIETNKIKLLIRVDLIVGNFDLITIDDRIFKVERISKYQIKITSTTESTWNVNNLMVQVKQIDGVFVYPTITTNYNVILL